MRKKAWRAPTDERGFVLITILLVIAALFPLILAFNSRVQLNLVQAENFRNSVQAVRMARAGVEGAMGLLRSDDRSFDSKRERWASPFPSLSVGEGLLAVRITDEDRKIPVNLLVESDGVSVNREIEARLRSLVLRLRGNPEIIDALIDWIDTNSTVTGSAGAEAEYYAERGVQCKNGPLDTIDELLLIRGFDRELVVERRLRDFLTVSPTDGKINVNTAEGEVLHSVLGVKTTGLSEPLNESDIDEIVRYRDQHEIKDLKDLEHVVKMATGQVQRIAALIKVGSSFFTVDSRYTLGRVTKNVEAVVQREGEKVRVTSWREE